MTFDVENRRQLENLCNNIAILRKRNNLSYSDMSKILHTSVKSLKSIESGHIPKRVSVDVIFYASRCFNCNLSNFFLENLGE